MERSGRAFTLTEVLIVMSLAAILLAVGAPVYSNYRRDSRLREGRSALEAVLDAEQDYYRKGKASYTTDRLVPRPQSAPPVQKLECDLTGLLARWDIRVIQADAHGFTAIATGRLHGPAAGLQVKLIHTRGGETRWEES